MKNINNKMINVRVNDIFYIEFQEHCKKNGYSISKRIRVLMEREIKNGDSVK